MNRKNFLILGRAAGGAGGAQGRGVSVETQKKGAMIALGIAIGTGIGAALGAATGQLAVWLPVGIVVGTALGAGLEQQRKRGLRDH